MTDLNGTGAPAPSAPHATLEAHVRRYYTDKLREHGVTARGVDWNSAESQQLRFAQLLTLCGSQPGTILDYGCGYGALLDYIRERDLRLQYRGYDMASSMIAGAVSAHPDMPGGTFTSEASELMPADFVVASGVLNVKLDASDADWHGYMLSVVERLAALSRTGFAFNALSTFSDVEKRRPHLHYADPLVWFDYCKRHLSKSVALLHDYPLYEFTIVVRH